MPPQPQPNALGLSGLARRLVAEGLLAEAEAEVHKAVIESTQHKKTLTAWLLERGLVDNNRLLQVASAEFGMPIFDISTLAPASMPVNLISQELMTKHHALPLIKRGKRLFVGIADPMQLHALDEIKFHSNCMVEPVLIERTQLDRAIDTVINTLNNVTPDLGGGDLDDLALESMDEEAETIGTGIDAIGQDDAPVVKFINKIMVDAIRRGASDIHFEPYETQYRIRLRVDGYCVLWPIRRPSLPIASPRASK